MAMTERRYRQVMIVVDGVVPCQHSGWASNDPAASCVTNPETAFHTGESLFPKD
jgi:hypothetical protein